MDELQEKEAGLMADGSADVGAQEPTPSSAEEEYDEQTAAEAERAAQELAENNALAAVFNDVRTCSTKSTLSTPDRWAEIGIVPAHMTAEDFEMYVYDYLEGYIAETKKQREEEKAAAKAKASTFHSARTAVGIPRVHAQPDARRKPRGQGCRADATNCCP